ncbi:MAG: YidB family protein [Bryobacteraceae bacterium]
MSLFDQIGAILGGSSGEGAAGRALLSGALELIGNHPGGLSGLISTLQQSGLGDVASSWVGNGANLPISADQIKSVLGSDRVAQFASKLGIPPDVASSHLAQLLPAVIDKLTSNGKLPEGGGDDLMSKGMALLSGLFSKGTDA